MPRAAVSVLVLDARIREPDVPIVVRQLVFPRPSCNLFGLTVRPAVAVLLAAIALVQEPLIVALQLVVEDDAPNPTALAAETLLGALVGAIDLGVVRQLARLPEAGVEGLAGFVGAVVTLVAVGLEQVTSAVRQVTARSSELSGLRANQPLASRDARGSDASFGIVAQVVQIALGHNPKRANGRQHAALGAVDLVDTVALPNRPALASARQVEVPREHVAWIALVVPVAIAACCRGCRGCGPMSLPRSRSSSRGSYLSMRLRPRHDGQRVDSICWSRAIALSCLSQYGRRR